MPSLSALVILHPALLAAGLILPLLWYLLRVTPPRPQQVVFPPLRLLIDLLPQQTSPARSPWWLTLLRMLVAALLIIAMSGPVWRPEQSANPTTQGPMLIMIDDGWAAARDWEQRQATARGLIELAAEQQRAVSILAFSRGAQTLVLKEAGAALTELRSLVPVAFTPDRLAALPVLRALINSQPDLSLVWISDGVRVQERESGDQTKASHEAFVAGFGDLLKGHSLTMIAPRQAPLALTGREDHPAGLVIDVKRAWAGEPSAYKLIARDQKARVLGQADGLMGQSELTQRVNLTLPLELRQDVARIEIDNGRSAGAVWLSDESQQRKRVAIVSESADMSQALLSPVTYITRALLPFAELRLSRQAPSEAVTALLAEHPSVLILADIGQLPDAARKQIEQFIEAGGLVLRFSNASLANEGDTLVPVPLRRGGRSLGGVLAWDTPRALSPFEADSPFFGLKIPQDVSINRQLLAEPGPDLSRKVWAHLVDGTPVVTAQPRGQGLLVLFHVSADPLWSSLPISGLFVDMLRRVIGLSGAQKAGLANPNASLKATSLAPIKTMDGFGQLGTPPATALPIKRDISQLEAGLVADRDHPAGLYGMVDAPLALNVLDQRSEMAALDVSSLAPRLVALEAPPPFDLRPWLIGLAGCLFALDGLAMVWLSGGLRGLSLSGARRLARLLIPLAVLLMVTQPLVAGPLSPKDTESALATRLAYVITGDAAVDDISLAGLKGLSDYIAKHTSLEPAPPVGVNPDLDELGVYPLIYWPMVANRPIPSSAGLARIDGFMKNGGTIIFDTRDAGFGTGSNVISPETKLLRSILAGMSVPTLEPVPSDHVVTRTFYLVEGFPGRYATGKTYIEALLRNDNGKTTRPTRAGDGVSPIVITSNDLASAWAVGRRGEALQPITQTMPRQREMALRGGVNLVMYTLTGNYKADQVHVPALLERLGR